MFSLESKLGFVEDLLRKSFYLFFLLPSVIQLAKQCNASSHSSSKEQKKRVTNLMNKKFKGLIRN